MHPGKGHPSVEPGQGRGWAQFFVDSEEFSAEMFPRALHRLSDRAVTWCLLALALRRHFSLAGHIMIHPFHKGRNLDPERFQEVT